MISPFASHSSLHSQATADSIVMDKQRTGYCCEHRHNSLHPVTLPCQRDRKVGGATSVSTRLECEGSHVSLVSGTLDLRRPLDVAPLERLSAHYAVARTNGDRASLLAIGRDLYAWLHGAEAWFGKLKQQTQRPFLLEV